MRKKIYILCLFMAAIFTAMMIVGLLTQIDFEAVMGMTTIALIFVLLAIAIKE